MEKRKKQRDIRLVDILPEEVHIPLILTRGCSGYLFGLAIRMLISTLTTLAAASVLLPMAYQERGYQAFGGEHLLMAVIFLLVFHISGRWLHD